MDEKLALLFPGQGSQYVGMGRDFFDSFALARETFEEADEILRFPLSQLIFGGPAEELVLTKNSQVAIYVASIAILRVVRQQFPDMRPDSYAGLSLGEYTAMVACNCIRFSDGVRLVWKRGSYMHEASRALPGTMVVVLGMDEEVVQRVVDGEEGVWVANFNCPGQIAISGTFRGIDRVGERLKALGAKKILPLDVSGAFHSGLMRGAREKLEGEILALDIRLGEGNLVMNVPGGYVTSPEEMRRCLLDQVVCPVRWERGIRAMHGRGVGGFIEIGCGRTLTGMNRRILGNGRFFHVDRLEDVEGLARALGVEFGVKG